MCRYARERNRGRERNKGRGREGEKERERERERKDSRLVGNFATFFFNLCVVLE